MTWQIMKSWALLFYIDGVMKLRGFKQLRSTVYAEKLGSREAPCRSAEDLCHAVDVACVFYFKRVLCLQRSAATALLLRQHGFRAELVIGVQMLPFLSHAWVEVNGHIVNDKPYVTEIFRVLDRC